MRRYRRADDKWGEAVKAFVVVKDGESLTESEVIAHCKAKLGTREISQIGGGCVREIPKTPAGKF